MDEILYNIKHKEKEIFDIKETIIIYELKLKEYKDKLIQYKKDLDILTKQASNKEEVILLNTENKTDKTILDQIIKNITDVNFYQEYFIHNKAIEKIFENTGLKLNEIIVKIKINKISPDFTKIDDIIYNNTKDIHCYEIHCYEISRI